MSYYRPTSPPPREPSPEPVHTPLPSPYLRARDRRRTQNTSPSPLIPPGLAPPRALLQSRSFDHLNRDPQHPTLKRRARSSLEPSVPPAQSSFSPPRSPNHRRTASVVAPRSPPPPSSSSVVPPVPPIPESARTSPLFRAQSRSVVTPIYLPELHDLSPVAQRSNNLSVPSPTAAAPEKKSLKRLPSLFSISSVAGSITGKADSTTTPGSPTSEKDSSSGKSKSTVMTCFKFFTMNRSSTKGIRTSPTTQ